MPENTAQLQEKKRLTRRYLIWCYKTTKEDLDRIDRYFTQLKADRKILGCLLKNKDLKKGPKRRDYSDKVAEFKAYMEKKRARVFSQKFADKEEKVLTPEYWYLKNRLEAVEKTICELLGKKELNAIQALYEEEMTRRILEAREHT